MSINPRKAMALALTRVQASPLVASAMGVEGRALRFGDIRAYNVHMGHVSLASSRVAWVEPRVLFLFQLVAENGATAMVSGEALKYHTVAGRGAGEIRFTLLSVDVASQPARAAPQQLLLLEGSEDKMHRKFLLRGLLQGERVLYMDQGREEDDDVRVAEQEALIKAAEEAAAAAGGGGEGATVPLGDGKAQEGGATVKAGPSSS